MFKNILKTIMPLCTADLDDKLKSTNDIQSYLSENEAEFDDKNFYTLLNTLIAESCKTKAKIAADSCISEPYLYNLINGEKRPTRDVVIKLSFGLCLSLKTTERLLKLAGYSNFYVRRKRDSILKYAFMNNLSLMEADDLLVEHGFSTMTE